MESEARLREAMDKALQRQNAPNDGASPNPQRRRRQRGRVKTSMRPSSRAPGLDPEELKKKRERARNRRARQKANRQNANRQKVKKKGKRRQQEGGDGSEHAEASEAAAARWAEALAAVPEGRDHSLPRTDSGWKREFARRADNRYKGPSRVKHENAWVGTGALRRAREGDVPAWLRRETVAEQGRRR